MREDSWNHYYRDEVDDVQPGTYPSSTPMTYQQYLKQWCPICRGTGWLENMEDLDAGFATSDCSFKRCKGPGPHREQRTIREIYG